MLKSEHFITGMPIVRFVRTIALLYSGACCAEALREPAARGGTAVCLTGGWDGDGDEAGDGATSGATLMCGDLACRTGIERHLV